MGLRLERWLAERGEDGPGLQAWPVCRCGPHPDEDPRAELTACAVLSGLALPPGARVPAEVVAGARLRVAGALTAGEAGSAARFVPNVGAWRSAAEEATARQDVALELLELLSHGCGGQSSSTMKFLMEDAGWPALLDVAECARTFGWLPQGELAASSRRVLFGTPVLAARALVRDKATAAGAVGPLLRTVLAPSIRASRGLSRERLRVTVLPGFSLLCWAAAMQLDRALLWPGPAMSFLVETLADAASGESFVRIWQFKDVWEMRPAWHVSEGPVRLSRWQEELRPLLALREAAVAEPDLGDVAPAAAAPE